MTAALLEIEGLGAGYGQMPVLHAVTMAVQPAEIVAMLGSNGAGKTTLLRAVSRLIDAQGAVRFDGASLAALTAEQVFGRGLVQVPEGRQLFEQMSVEENLRMGAFRRRDRSGVAGALEHVYALFPRLFERRRQTAGSLSGGEQQMCAIGRALMAAPRMIMVDEMSLGLAPLIVDQLLDILARIRAQGVTVLLVEQDVHAALSIADRGYVLESGRIVREGSARALLADPAVQKAYLGL